VSEGDCRINNAGGGEEPSLVAGLVIVVSDGNDTAGSLEQALAARGDRRTIFISVGQGIDDEVASAIGNVGTFDAEGGVVELGAEVSRALDRVNGLNQAIYVAHKRPMP
jgi:hypothetical protein